MPSKKILVLYTGGTIGMKKSQIGLVPDAEEIKNFFKSNKLNYDITLIQSDPIIDSSGLSLLRWKEWVSIIQQNAHQFSGILILHGTDTLAYSAAFFAYALKNKLSIPVFITGSQYPLSEKNSDAAFNLQVSFKAFELDILGCYIIFNGKVFSAFNTSKIRTEGIEAFETKNKLPYFELKENKWIKKELIHSLKQNIPDFSLNTNLKIVNFYLIPGYSIDMMIDGLNRQLFDAVIIQAYGSGNIPMDPLLLAALKRQTKQNKIVLTLTQTYKGQVSLTYESAYRLSEIGVLSGGNLRIETAIALLTILLSSTLKFEEIKNILLEEIEALK